MHKRISLLLPTRGRPRLVERFLASILEQSLRPELIEVILCVDDDDPGSHGIRFPGLEIVEIIGPRQNMGAYNAICLERSTGDITIAVNDDMIVRTRGWDEKVRALDARFPDGVYLGYGNDLFKGRKLCTFPILSRRLAGVMSQPYPRIYRGAFIDVHLMDIFRRLGKAGHDRLAYCEDVVFEHVHYRVDAAAMDATYAERARFGDDMTFIALADLRRAEANRLLRAIESPDAPQADRADPPVSIATPGPVTIISLCASKFLFDTSLPFTWRFYLCSWMIARFYYSYLRRPS
jgi:hypothetical protein